MVCRKLVIGVSALALAAGSAGAETTVAGTNRSTITQTGTGNTANVNNIASGNDENASTVTQNGINNAATVEQVGDLNISRARQVGNDGRVTHRQNGDRNTADSEQTGDKHSSSVAQQGNDNFGAASQSGGDRNSSTIDQARAAANGRTARVTQRGSDNVSNIIQEGSQQVATVVQGTGSILSNGNMSGIQQRHRGQTAEVLLIEGSAAAGNTSWIGQENRLTGPSGFTSNNRANVAIRGFGNSSSISQDGDNNSARVTMLGGGAGGTDAETGRTQGNRSTVFQTGRGLTAIVAAGSSLAGEGQGNWTTISQTTGLAQPGEAGHHAIVWQTGNLDTSDIVQAETSDVLPVQRPISYSDGTSGRAVADVAQRSSRGAVIVRQAGDNAARVTQGLGSRSIARVEQDDAGDLGLTGDAGDAVNRAFNRAVVAQNGFRNDVSVRQHSINANAVIFQMPGSSYNQANIGQGVRGEETLEPVPAPEGANTRNLTAQVRQGGTRNHALVRQHGSSLQATVEQLGSGTEMLPNRATIRQRGEGNRAIARQGADVGSSDDAAPGAGEMGDEFYFRGGARSAEIAIIQSNSGNSATVEQRGRGQFARVEQSGARNTAAILQEAGGTNATAVIRQSGNDNSYTVTQNQPGQYLVVSQSGNNNSSTDVVQRGPRN